MIGTRRRQAPVNVTNEIVIAAGARETWAELATVSRWPDWYEDCAWTSTEVAGPLAARDTFSWKAHPIALHSTVIESEPGRIWRFYAVGRGMAGDATFLFKPVPGGTRVRLIEPQTGLLPYVGRAFLRGSLARAHQSWLENLRDRVTGAATATAR